MKRKRLIRIEEKTIHLAKDYSIGLEKTSLDPRYLTFKSSPNIFWEIEISLHNKITGEIKCEVTDFNPTGTDRFNSQFKKSDVHYIAFEPIEWEKLESFLSVYHKKQLINNNIALPPKPVDKISDEEIDRTNKNPFETLNRIRQIETKENASIHYTYNSNKPTNFDQKSPLLNGNTLNNKPSKTTRDVFTEKGRINLDEITYQNGYATFRHFVKRKNQNISLKVKNPFLKEEFNNIKPYLKKALKDKSTRTYTTTLTYIKSQLIEEDTSADIITSINSDIIEKVKVEFLKLLTRNPENETPSKKIFTSGEILANYHVDLATNNLELINDHLILQSSIETSYGKNAPFINHLSEIHRSENTKVRYTLKPHFGFIFCIEKSEKVHFCWELKDSHATYIWTFEKNENSEFEHYFNQIEKEIAIIIQSGRDFYKSTYKKNYREYDFEFTTIEHKRKLMDNQKSKSFEIWKEHLDKIINQ